jgi:PST family polysaccharide transporter
MEIIAILRVLWARRVLLVLGLLVACALGFKLGAGATPSSGFAWTRVLLDTPKSQLIDRAPRGLETLQWRAGLLASLLASDDIERRIARDTGIPREQLGVVDLSLTTPTVLASMPKAAAEAAAVTYEPYVLTVAPDESLPVVNLHAVGPHRAQAARLLTAAAKELEAEAPYAQGPTLQGLVFNSAAPVRSREVPGSPNALKGAAAAFLFILWVGFLAITPGLGRLWRATAGEPWRPSVRLRIPRVRLRMPCLRLRMPTVRPRMPTVRLRIRRRTPARRPSAGAKDGIAGRVRRGLVWGTVNSLVLRMGSLVVGIVLARLLAPADLGVYAIALTVQSILMTLADLGMSVDLVRSEDPARRAPTVATLGVASGVTLSLLMSAAATPIAHLMGGPEAAPVIAVLSLTLVVSGAGVVPYAYLQREFEQRKLFACGLVDFVVSTTTTIGLVKLGMGPMALAIGRVVAQTAAIALQFVLTRTRPKYGFDREIARSALGYGAPLAAANLLSWALLNIDNVVIARVAGVTALGFYVLAFNISNWPINAISQAVRGVSLAGFSRTADDRQEGSLAMALALTWSVALLAGVLLAALSDPLIVLLYGHRWSAAIPVLAALGFFGALRVALDLLATYLMAKGAARPVLYVQIVWFVALIPAVIVGTQWLGIAGAAWAHLAVSALGVLPAYAIALRHVGTSPLVLLKALWPPLLAGAPTWWVAHLCASNIHQPLLALVAGGAAGCVTYAAISYRRIRRLLPDRGRRREAPVPRIDQPSLEGVT